MLSVERFAELRAAMERAADRDEVLRQAGITPRAWIQLQRHWLNALAAEVTRGRDDLAARYRGAFDRASGTTPASSAPATSTAPVVAILGAAAASPAATVAHDAPPPPTGPAGHLPYMPSYLVGMPRDLGAGAPPASMATPSPQAAPAFPAPAFPAPAVALPAASSLAGTSLALNIPRGPALPFPSAASPAAPASSAAPAPAPGPGTAPAPGPGTGTALDISAAVAAAKKKKNPTTPFKRPTGPDAPPVAPPSAPAAPAPAPASAPAAPAPAASAPAAPAPTAPASPPPGGAAPEPPVPELTVEQYAWLVAALRHATAPADAERVLAQLRLPPESQRPLQERWRARMAADPALQAQFFAALQRQVKARGG